MTVSELCAALEATNGNLSQDALRQYTGSYQLVQRHLGQVGLAQRLPLKGKRLAWQLVVPLAEALEKLRRNPDIVITRNTVGRPPQRNAAGAPATHHAARHWRVVYDPEERFSEQARFGITDMRESNGTWAAWLVPGITFEHDENGEQRCFYEGRLQRL